MEWECELVSPLSDGRRDWKSLLLERVVMDRIYERGMHKFSNVQ